MKTWKRAIVAAMIFLSIISETVVATASNLADSGVAVNRAVVLQESDVDKLCRETLDMLANYWEYGEEYMVYTANREFISYDDIEPVVVSAEEYEQVLNKYFVIGSDRLERIRNGVFGATYNQEDNTYTLEYTGGFGGALPKREYINYVGDPRTDYSLRVYYRDINYGFLRDVLPEGTDEYAYIDQYADPETGAVEYGGFVYENGPEGYYRFDSYADTGMLYYTYYYDTYLQLNGAVSVDYVDDFTYTLNSDNEITITKYVGRDSVVYLPESYIIDGEECPVTTISDAFAWVDCVDALYLPESLKKIYSWSFAYAVGPTVFYEGTQEQWDAIEIGSPNSFFGPHIGYSEATFGGNDCWYCPHCDEYLLENANFATANIILLNYDGSVFSTIEVNYKEDNINDIWGRWGDALTRTPQKPSDDQYTYSFRGWHKQIEVPITGDQVLSPVFDAYERTYTITFQYPDGRVIETLRRGWGAEVKPNRTPWKDSDNIYNYTFAGWDKEVVPCAGDAVYTATFKAEYIDYTVRFWLDDQLLSEQTYHWGEKISLPPDPSKESDSMYNYSFLGWRRRTAQECEIVTTCDGNEDYYAIFSGENVVYNAIWKDWDGTILHQDTFFYGGIPDSAPQDPTREPDNEYSYNFIGWTYREEENGDKIYTAEYSREKRWYLVTFVDWNGNFLADQNCYWGDEIYPPIPYRAPENGMIYTFIGWDKEIVPCEGDAVYTACYSSEQEQKRFTVTFKDEDGTVISSKVYSDGEPIVFPETPTKQADNVYSYSFVEWAQDIDGSGNIIYTATYAASYIEYTIEFLDWDGTALKTINCHWGDRVSAPGKVIREDDKTYKYTFAGWDKKVETTCSGNAVYTASYSAVYINYTVAFKTDGTTLSKKTYHYGDTVVVPTAPIKESEAPYAFTYRFAGWDSDVSATCTGDAVYNATFIKEYIEYTVVFKDWDGRVISTATYRWGDAILFPENPVRPNDDLYIYEFTGWNDKRPVCEGDATYVATYSSSALPPETPPENPGDDTQFKKGDVNMSGGIDAFDYALIKRAYLGTTTLTDEQLKLADINDNGKIDVTEYGMVKRHYLGTFNLYE